MKITKQEQEIIDAIVFSDYYDPSVDPVGQTVWGGYMYLCKGRDALGTADVSKESLGGVMSSLQQKGLVSVVEDKCEGVDEAVRPSSAVTLLEPARPFIGDAVKKHRGIK